MERNLISFMWGFFMLVPLPWRPGVVIGIIAYLSFELIQTLLPLLLLPEYWVTSYMRNRGFRPLPGSYVFGNFIIGTIRISRIVVWIIVLLVGVWVILWNIRSSLGNPLLISYIDLGIDRWHLLESSILSN